MTGSGRSWPRAATRPGNSSEFSSETRHLSSVFCNPTRGFHGLRFIPGMKSAHPVAQRLPALPGVSAPSEEAWGPPSPNTVTEAQVTRRPGDATWCLPWPHMSCGRSTCRLQERERERETVCPAALHSASASRSPHPGKGPAGRLWVYDARGRTRVQGPATAAAPSAASGRAAVLGRGSHGPPAGRRPRQSPGEEGVTLSSERH